MDTPAIAYPLPGSSGNVAGTATLTTGAEYRGCTVRETVGAAAVVRIRAGSVSGTILDDVSLAANGSTSTLKKVQFVGPLYFELVSGAAEGSAFIA